MVNVNLNPLKEEWDKSLQVALISWFTNVYEYDSKFLLFIKELEDSNELSNLKSAIQLLQENIIKKKNE